MGAARSARRPSRPPLRRAVAVAGMAGCMVSVMVRLLHVGDHRAPAAGTVSSERVCTASLELNSIDVAQQPVPQDLPPPASAAAAHSRSDRRTAAPRFPPGHLHQQLAAGHQRLHQAEPAQRHALARLRRLQGNHIAVEAPHVEPRCGAPVSRRKSAQVVQVQSTPSTESSGRSERSCTRLHLVAREEAGRRHRRRCGRRTAVRPPRPAKSPSP